MSEANENPSLLGRLTKWADNLAAGVHIHPDGIPPHHELKAINDLREKPTSRRHQQPPER